MMAVSTAVQRMWHVCDWIFLLGSYPNSHLLMPYWHASQPQCLLTVAYVSTAAWWSSVCWLFTYFSYILWLVSWKLSS